jgi:hypothetical protein
MNVTSAPPSAVSVVSMSCTSESDATIRTLASSPGPPPAVETSEEIA